jgi:hypothetical protein
VTLRARWVTLRARWVTLRARWVTLRARWVTLRDLLGDLQARRAAARDAGSVAGSLGLGSPAGLLTGSPHTHSHHRRDGGLVSPSLAAPRRSSVPSNPSPLPGRRVPRLTTRLSQRLVSADWGAQRTQPLRRARRRGEQQSPGYRGGGGGGGAGGAARREGAARQLQPMVNVAALGLPR